MSYDKDTQSHIEMVIKMLNGSFDPEKDMPKKHGIPGPEQMKIFL